MYLLMVGINDARLPGEARERIAQLKDLPHEFPQAVRQLDKVSECIVIPTYSGIEIYLATTAMFDAEKNLIEFLSQTIGIGITELRRNIYIYSLNDCIRHLFRVVAGMEGGITRDAASSLAIAREVFETACHDNTSDVVLCTLFNKAIEVAENAHLDTEPLNEAYQDMVEHELKYFLEWLNTRFVSPTVGALNKKGKLISEQALERALNRLSDFSPQQKEVVISLADSIVTELLSAPVTKIESLSGTEQGHLYTEILKNLFCLRKER